MKRIFKAVVPSLGLLILVVAGSAGAEEPLSPQALFEKRCSKCHDLKRTQRTETAEAWQAIVKRMAKKWFSGITNDEADVIAGYLAENRAKE